MRPAFLFASSLRRLALFAFAAVLSLTGVVAHAQTTTFTGLVYSPLGPPPASPVAGTIYGDPIPNILVFIQNTNDASGNLPVFTQGVTIPTGSQTGCQAQQNLVPSTVLGSALTDPTGTFSFNVTGVLPTTLNVVIQAGKWRRVYSYPSSQFTAGGKVVLPTMSMPASTTQGDLPHIAVVTGSADAVECIFPQIGISAAEVTDPTAATPGSINLFYGGGSGGEVVDASTPLESQLVNPAASGAIPMTNYDLVIFGCQGSATTDATNQNAYYNTLLPYTTDGGRVFLTHYEWPWVSKAFPSVATWWPTEHQSFTGTVTGELDTSFSGEPILSAWMKGIKALDISTTPPEFSLTNVRWDIETVNTPSQSWVTLPNSSGNPSVQFSFDTPLGATGQPSAVLNFTNNTQTFLEGDPNDSITVNVSNNSTAPTTAGLTLTLSIPSSLVPTSLVDSSGGSWICSLSTPAVCTLPIPLGAGVSDAVTLTFKIPSTATLGLYSLVGGLTNGGLNQSSQCGRVLYNDYHVENAATAKQVWTNGKACTQTTALDSAQKFLEYSLYNLSNFVAPANTDTIQIQQDSLITWPVPTPLYYGTLLSQIEDATVNTPGTTTYTITPAPTYVAYPTLPDVNTFTVKAAFTPNDIVDYISSSMTQTVTILPDPTTSYFQYLETSIFYGQEIGYDPAATPTDATLNTLTQTGLPNLLSTPTAVGGNYAVTIDGTTVCSGVLGQPINGGSRPGACPDTGFQGWGAGQHTVILAYAGAPDFAASTSGPQVVSIAPDPTTTTMSTTATGTGTLGSNVSYTVAVADTYTTAVGTVTLYDSPTPVSGISSPTGTMVAIASSPTTNGGATLALSTLAVGTHNVVACFAAPLNSAGLPNMKSSCTSSIPQVVTPIPSPLLGTVTTLKSSTNPSPAGNAVTFTATIQTTGAFTTIPTGSVTFYDGTNPLGSATSVSATGTATYTSSSLTLGTHNITAVYAGSSTMATSTSAVLPEVIVNPLVSAGPDFLLLVNPVTVPVYVGSSALVTVQVVAIGTFTSQVALTCTGLPAQSSCAFAQSTIQAGGGTTEMIVSSSAPHDCNQNDPYFSGMGGESIIGLLGLSTLTLCFARRRRKLQMVALAAVLLLLPSVLSGCGTSNCTDFGVKPGDYSFTLTATPSSSSITTKTQAMVMHVHL